MNIPKAMGLGLLCLSTSQAIQAMETEYGVWDADARLRHESVEQDNALKDATANTLHGRLGFTTKAWNGFSFSIQGEAVTVLGNEDYNSGPDGNGNTAFSVIPDPEGEQINQLWLAYNGLPDTSLKLGRQRIIYDNARFVGNVGWRQNEQTFDGLTVTNKSFANTVINYAYLTQANNIFFQKKELDKGNLLNVSHEYSPGNKLGAYGYFLDYEPGMGSDTRTLGVSAGGQLFKNDSVTTRYRLEYARQSDYADASSSFDLDYSLIELALLWNKINLKGGIETLEGDGMHAFTTPLATLHAFNGWADQFLATPKKGLVDRYLSAGTAINGVGLKIVYHDFVSDIGGIDHGTEWDASLSYSPAPGWTLLLKYADYVADETAVDTEKLWLQAAYKF